VLLSFLNKAYPYIPSKRPAWLNNLFIGIFVALFLIIFQPFDLSVWQTPNKTLKLIGFGLVSFLMPTLFGWIVFKLVPKHHFEDQWKVWKEILLVMGLLMSIALGNLLYSKLIHIAEINWKGFINSAIVTVLLGLFPITLAILNKYHRLLRLNLETAQLANDQIAHPPSETSPPAMTESATDKTIPSEEKALRFVAENEKDLLEISEKQLLYIESQDNYASVVFLDKGKIKKQLIRSSLKRMEAQVQLPHIKRCHRAFMVNLSKVTKVEGNAAGYTLSFSEGDTKVPVSRNYGPEVMSYFKAGV
jgi:hypothetical protein